MKLFFRLCLIFFFIFSGSGCAAILIGSGVVGGMAISADTVQSYVDRNFDSLWKISISVLEEMGSISEKNKHKGLIRAVVEKSNVTIKLEKVTRKTTRLKISARKIYKLLPNINLATKVNNRIVKETSKGWF